MIKDKITITQAARELEVALDKYDWFCTTVVEDRAICVYVTKMDKEVSDFVPDFVYGYQVKLGYEAYLTCGDKYGKRSSDLVSKLEEIS
jgi:hypothetical protein